MRKLRFFLYSFLIVVILVLAYLYVVPFGKISYSHDFSNNYYNLLGGKGFFHKLGPLDRLSGKNRIIGDPVYFYLKTPRSFSRADLKIKYSISPELEKSLGYMNIEAGVLVDKENWHYDLKPIFNSTLNQLINDSNFNVSLENNLLFAQRKNVSQFSNVKDFLNQGDYKKSLFYNYSPAYNFKLADSNFRNDILTNISNLRGSHVFYTYINNEELKINFSWSLKDVLNNKSTSETVNIFVYYQNEAIFSDEVSIEKDSIKKYELNLPNLPEGAYKIEIKTADNVITKELKTGLNRLSFVNRVWLDDLNNGFSLYSNKNNFRIKSVDSDCLGEVKVGENSISINKIYEQFDFSVPSSDKGLNKIESDSCGLLIENNGLFSFSENSFFNPLLDKLDADTEVNNYDYILADYQMGEISFDLSRAVRDKDGYRFLISAPFLNTLDENKYIEIQEMEVKLQGRTLFEKIKDILKK